MAAEVFVDTSAWYPIAVTSHPDHKWLADALKAAIRGGRRIVTTNLVVAETYTLLLARAGQPAALGFFRAVKKSPNEVVSSTPELEDRAITRMLESKSANEQFNYKETGENPQWRWIEGYQICSFADAVSREVMAERGIHEVLSLTPEWGFRGVRVLRVP